MRYGPGHLDLDGQDVTDRLATAVPDPSHRLHLPAGIGRPRQGLREDPAGRACARRIPRAFRRVGPTSVSSIASDQKPPHQFVRARRNFRVGGMTAPRRMPTFGNFLRSSHRCPPSDRLDMAKGAGILGRNPRLLSDRFPDGSFSWTSFACPVPSVEVSAWSSVARRNRHQSPGPKVTTRHTYRSCIGVLARIAVTRSTTTSRSAGDRRVNRGIDQG
jgi:hypothetical protein